MDDSSLVCFVLRCILNERPIAHLYHSGVNLLKIDQNAFERIVHHIALDHTQVRQQALRLRTMPGHTGYKRSIFRQFPCVLFGGASERIHSPLPDLLTLRGTTGLFYDLIGAPDQIRNEISTRFENYCLKYLQAYFVQERASKSFAYHFKGNRIDSPDILLRRNSFITVVIECKATRMSYEARFSESPIADASRGYKEMSKGVFQIWRFVSHVRRGLVGEDRLAEDVKGILFTLDTWLSMADALHEEVLAQARQLCLSRDPEIIAIDQIPIIFCPIDDLETTLQLATEASFFQCLQAATTNQYQGWHLRSVHQEVAPDISANNAYPFGERIGEVVDWWSRFQDSSEMAAEIRL